MEKEMTASEIIDALGGTSKVARIFGISAPSVHEWRAKAIPKARLMYLQAVYPHLFNGERRSECRRVGDRRRSGDRRAP